MKLCEHILQFITTIETLHYILLSNNKHVSGTSTQQKWSRD